jgi:ABC-type dipeptide/oligopeptide/nickel transport system permease component
MLTYIVRRVLYSIPVLFASSFLCFLFVSEAGDPLGQIRIIPRISQQTIANLTHQYHLDQPVIVRYWYWLESVFTQRFG